MRVYMNFREVRGPYGGANAFQRTIRRALERRGWRVTTDPGARYDEIGRASCRERVSSPV